MHTNISGTVGNATMCSQCPFTCAKPPHICNLCIKDLFLCCMCSCFAVAAAQAEHDMLFLPLLFPLTVAATFGDPVVLH